MDEERLSPEEERAWLKLMEQAALNDFPNPERIGCPGSEFLRRLALNRSSVSPNDERIGHLSRCSPCFQEFTALRSEPAEGIHQNPTSKVAAIVVLLLAIGAGVYFERADIEAEATRIYTRVTGTYVAASLDLSKQSTLRGANAPDANASIVLPTLPRQRLDLTITLPFASEPGEYDLAVSRISDSPIVAASGQARIDHGNTILSVRIDLSSLPRGRYDVALRRAQSTWAHYPVSID